VQQRLLPRSTPQLANVEFAWKYKPCDTLGGDILNVFELGAPRRIALYLLDVSGHGVQAALLSSSLSRVISPAAVGEQAVLAAARPRDAADHVPPATVCERLNRRFQMDPVTLQYFTLLYGVLDLRESSFCYAAAGHPGPILLAPDGEATHYPTTGSAIGLFRDPCCQEVTVPLRPGCRILLFSDGISEVRKGNDEFGVTRIVKAMRRTRVLPLDESLDQILDEVLHWAGTDQEDDMSLLAFEIQGQPSP
jgi:sigma-B regulation protein RsbU (phosphoserine phosphatase)